jgi:endonuclease/exonuclease/phosphatase family metal-dependent hydrolase
MPEAREHERSNPRRGNATFHTTVWKLRVDYVLPSAGLATEQTGVFWPVAEHQHAHLVAGTSSSDHRLVWADVRLPELS